MQSHTSLVVASIFGNGMLEYFVMGNAHLAVIQNGQIVDATFHSTPMKQFSVIQPDTKVMLAVFKDYCDASCAGLAFAQPDKDGSIDGKYLYLDHSTYDLISVDILNDITIRVKPSPRPTIPNNDGDCRIVNYDNDS